MIVAREDANVAKVKPFTQVVTDASLVTDEFV
jgi:hypothetical protein